MKYEEKRETYANIATMYYMGEMSQDDIAELYQISRYKVSRILKKCRTLKIVEFRINNQPTYYKKLEAQIMNLLGLKSVTIVVPGSTLDESKANVGKAASRYLIDHISNDMIVGFDWGTTMQTLVREFSVDKKYENCLFLQISGNIVSPAIVNKGYMDGHDIVRALSAKASAKCSVFSAPYIVKNKMLKKLLLEEPEIKKHIDLFNKLDMVFFGVGSSTPERCASFYSSYLTKEECHEMLKSGPVGEIFSTQLNKNGQAVDNLLSGRVMTIDLDVLKCVPNSVALAAGAEKAISLISGAKGQYFNRVIIDEIAALSILNFFEKCNG